MNRTKMRLVALSIATSVVLSGCKTLDTMANNPTVSSIGAGAGTAAVSYLACHAMTNHNKKKQCIAAALAAGAVAGTVTYVYLNKQLKKMQEIENLEARPCEATDSNREAYCVFMNENAVRFASGSSSINAQSEATLRQVASVLNESNDTLVYIEGHTDADGPESYNQKLSEQRALSVKTLFQHQGVQNGRMQALGYGENKPLTTDPALKSYNRRVEIRVEGEQP